MFLVVEEPAPHGINIFEIRAGSKEILRGEELWMRDLNRYNECMTSREWPSYPDKLLAVDLSRYQLAKG